MACCPERAAELPIEFRLALGASCRPDKFDGTAILNLSRDPGVVLDKCGNLIVATVRDGLDAIASPRVGASSSSPQAVYRSGFGVRLAWDLALRVATSRLGFIPPAALVKPEVNDGSLWHLASLFALSTADPLTFEDGSPFPPYLFLTVNYQHYLEQWFRVELDPGGGASNSGAATSSMEFNPQTKTAERTLSVRLVTQRNYKKAMPSYFPSFDVNTVDCATVTALPAFTAVFGGYQTIATLSAALPDRTENGASVGLTDGILLNLNNSLYGWKLLTLTAISDDRKTLTLFSKTTLGGEFLVPPNAPIGFRTVTTNFGLMLTTYKVVDFDDAEVARGPQQPFVSAYLIGNASDL